jgi:hypothetical protein
MASDNTMRTLSYIPVKNVEKDETIGFAYSMSQTTYDQNNARKQTSERQKKHIAKYRPYMDLANIQTNPDKMLHFIYVLYPHLQSKSEDIINIYIDEFLQKLYQL